MRLSRAVEEFLQEMHVERAIGTYKAYRGDLQLLVSVATVQIGDKVAAFTPAVVRAYFQALADRGLQTETLIRHRSSLSEFAKWAVRRRLLPENPMLIAAPKLRRPKRLPRPYSVEERQRLLALVLPPDEEALRALLFYAGLRVSEVAHLRWPQVRLAATDRPGALRILGKGNKERIVPMLAALDAALRVWLAAPLVEVRMLAGGPVLERRGGPLNARYIERTVARWGERAEVAHATPHRFRHTTATLCFELGMDVRIVQRFLGHESLDTTMRYTAVVDPAMEAAVAALDARLGVLPRVILPAPPVPANPAP